jgi:two-component system, cell cycle response regulator
MRRFHTIVAHKLRTPVALLYNSMAFLETRLKTIPPEDVKTFVNTAWVGSKRLADTVRDIINYIDAPMMTQPVNRTELKKLEELAIAIQQRYEIRPLTIHLPEDLRCRSVTINISALEIILSETIENAKKFHPKGDPTIELTITPQGSDRVRISLQDDGLSLTAQQLKWAMKPYFQGEKYFTGEVAGIGLGLPTAAMLTWQAGGELYIGNREEQPGIRVDISLPILPD